MKKYLILSSAILFLKMSLPGQSTDILFDGDFDNTPFSEFVQNVQDQTGASFYFLSKWIEDITVSVTGEGISLRNTLERTLSPKAISFNIVDDDQIFLSDKGAYREEIPDYNRLLSDLTASGVTKRHEGLTETEQKYIDGRKQLKLDTIVIGEGEAYPGDEKVVINGKILDQETGEALAGATVFIVQLQKGAASDMDGLFTIPVPPGGYTVEFKCMGMRDKRYHMQVLSSGTTQINLDRRVIALKEVTAQANRYHNIRGTQMGVNRIDFKVLQELPVVFGEKDIFKVAQMLPGVNSVGEGSAGFNVRGSAHDQNMVYLNKVPIYNCSHMFGFFNSFNPNIVKDFTLLKSNFPASYGGRIASFLDITTHQGNMNKFGASGGLSPVAGNLTIESPILKGKCSLLLSGRASYSDWLLNHIDLYSIDLVDQEVMQKLEIPILENSKANFYDLAGAFTYDPGKRTIVKAFGYYSDDKFILNNSNDYAYSSKGGSLSVKQRLGSRFNINLTYAYSQYQFNNVNSEDLTLAYTQDYQITHQELKVDMNWFTMGKNNFKFGSNLIYYDLNRGSLGPRGTLSQINPVELGADRGLEMAAYLADELSLFRWLSLYGGVRFVQYHSLGPQEVLLYEAQQALEPWNVLDTIVVAKNDVAKTYNSIEPRVSVNFMLGRYNSLKFSYNRARQFIFMLTNTTAISPTDQWKLCDYYHEPLFVEQYSAGYYLNIPKGDINLSLEFYHKDILNVSEYKDGVSFVSTPNIETKTISGNQEAYGLEVMLRKGTGKLTGWLAYSYTRSFIQISSAIPGESINNGLPYSSNFDRPHSLSLVSTLRSNRRLSLSSTVVYLTGRPVTYPISLFYMDGLQFIKYSERNQFRIPDYFRWDISIIMEGNLKKKKLVHSTWTFNIYNLTSRQNAYSVFFDLEDGYIQGYKLSIFARTIVTLSWNFKIGNYATK